MQNEGVQQQGWGRGVPGVAGWVLEGAIPGTTQLDGKTLGILATTSRTGPGAGPEAGPEAGPGTRGTLPHPG